MSSFAAKKRSTLLTRKKTKKRLARLGLDASYSAGQMKRETVYPGNKRFKYGACDTITRKAVSFADDVNPESALVAHHVRIIIDGNKRKEAAAQLYLDVRREEASRRRKELIVFVMDGDRAVLRTPKLLRLTQIWKRVTSNRHKEINSGKQKAVSYKGCRLLHSQLKKAQIKDILAEIKSGKTSLLITHDAMLVHLFDTSLVLKRRIGRIIQVTRFPNADNYHRRMRLLRGGRSHAFFSAPFSEGKMKKFIKDKVCKTEAYLPGALGDAQRLVKELQFVNVDIPTADTLLAFVRSRSDPIEPVGLSTVAVDAALATRVAATTAATIPTTAAAPTANCVATTATTVTTEVPSSCSLPFQTV